MLLLSTSAPQFHGCWLVMLLLFLNPPWKLHLENFAHYLPHSILLLFSLRFRKFSQNVTDIHQNMLGSDKRTHTKEPWWIKGLHNLWLGMNRYDVPTWNWCVKIVRIYFSVHSIDCVFHFRLVKIEWQKEWTRDTNKHITSNSYLNKKDGKKIRKPRIDGSRSKMPNDDCMTDCSWFKASGSPLLNC